MTLESGLTVARFSLTNQNCLLCTVTNEIASFCIDNRLRQFAFLVFAKVGKGGTKASFRVMLKYMYFEMKRAFRYYIKQIDSMCASVQCLIHIDHRRRQNAVRTSVAHSATLHVPLFFLTTFWRHL